jgi:hypothetical protein
MVYYNNAQSSNAAANMQREDVAIKNVQRKKGKKE